jgi:hypothetical protein
MNTRNEWSQADDEVVVLHYLRYGNAEHDQLIAKLPRHNPQSVPLRLRNFAALDGVGRLTRASKQQRDLWAFVSAVRDRPAFAAMVLEGLNR